MDAFSALAAGPAAAAAAAGQDPSQLIAFFAQEMQLFFQHIQKAVTDYGTTGELPNSLFSKKAIKAIEKAGGAKRGGKQAGEKRKRKPSAFNLFIQERLAEMKASGVQPPKEMTEGDGKVRNPLFAMAVKDWGALSQEAKDAYTAKVAPRLAAMADGDGDGAAAAATAAAAAAAAKAEAESEEEEESEEESDDEEEEDGGKGGDDEEEEEEEESESESESESSEEEEPPKKAPPPPPPAATHKKKKQKH